MSKLEVTIDGDSLSASFSAGSRVEFERLYDALWETGCAVWPLPKPEQDAPAPKQPKQPKKPRKPYTVDATKPLKPGSFDAKVLEMLREGFDAVGIADLLDKSTGIVSMAIARLRKRGLAP